MKSLAKLVCDKLASDDFNYSSVVEILLYLAGNTHPGITYTVYCATRYMFCQKHLLKHALKKIWRCLSATIDKGLIMKPSQKVIVIDCFLDASFSGMNRNEERDDHFCVNSRSGYVILVANFLFWWQLNLQHVTTLSTVEAKIFAIAHSCINFFPLWLESVSSLVWNVGD